MRSFQTSRGRVPTSLRTQLEGLESRLCLSVTVAAIEKPNGTELKITGDAAANSISIVDQGNGHVDVTNASGKLLGAADNVRSIKLDAKGGADSISYTLAQPLTHAQALIFDLGAGKNEANLDFSPGVNGVNLKVEVNGGDGADAIDLVVGSLTAARLKLDVNGGEGKDDISVTGAGLSIDLDSALVAHIAGNEGADTINTALDGQILGRINYTAAGGKGADAITANVTVAAGSTGKLRAVERGGKGIDDVTLNVIDNSAEAPETGLEVLNAKISDLLGGDTLSHTDNVTVVTTSV